MPRMVKTTVSISGLELVRVEETKRVNREKWLEMNEGWFPIFRCHICCGNDEKIQSWG